MFRRTVFILFFLTNLLADEVNFVGEFKPGSLIFGKGDDVVQVMLNSRILDLDESGNFVFGFDRDEKGIQYLKVKFESGKSLIRRIVLPNREYNIQRINNMKSKYVTAPNTEEERIKREREIINIAKKKIGDEKKALYKDGFIRPVEGGVLTSVFGSQRILNGVPRNAHNGLDIAAPTGTPVYAMADGIVRLAADNFYYSGNFIILDHGQGLNSSYLHLSNKDVKEGDFVKKGQKIGEIGTTGRSTGPHLHWSVQWFGKRTDPALLLKINSLEQQ